MKRIWSLFAVLALLARIRDQVFGALRRLTPAKLEGRDRGDLISLITAAGGERNVETPETLSEVEESAEAGGNGNTVKLRKIWAVAALIGVACFGGALGMAHSVAKAANNMAEQPEAAGQIRTSMMMGLVFIETVIIYALIVAILIIFVL